MHIFLLAVLKQSDWSQQQGDGARFVYPKHKKVRLILLRIILYLHLNVKTTILHLFKWNSPMWGCQEEKRCFLQDHKWVLAFPAWTRSGFAPKTQWNPPGYASTALSCCMSCQNIHHSSCNTQWPSYKKKKKRENQFVLAAGWFSKAADLHSEGEKGSKARDHLLSDHLNITSSIPTQGWMNDSGSAAWHLEGWRPIPIGIMRQR